MKTRKSNSIIAINTASFFGYEMPFTLQILSYEKICSLFLTLSSLFQLHGHIPDICFQKLIITYNKNRKYRHKNASYEIDFSPFKCSDFRTKMQLLEFNYFWAPTRLCPADYNFIMNLNFEMNRPRFVKENGHAILNYHIIEKCNTFSKVCDRCCRKFLSNFFKETVKRHKKIPESKAQEFFQDSDSWCAECVTQTLFFYCDLRHCSECNF